MSRRHLWVDYYQDFKLTGISLLFPAVEANLPVLDILFKRLHHAWLEYQLCTPAILRSAEFQIAQAIAAIIPSAPGLGLKMDLLKKDSRLFEDLFLHGADGGNPKLLELHHFSYPSDREQWEPGKEITAEDLPFPSSGNPYADAIAVSLYQFTAPDAKTMGKWLDAETRVGVLRVLRELNRNPDERISEFLKEVYEDNQRLHGDEFEKQFFEDW